MNFLKRLWQVSLALTVIVAVYPLPLSSLYPALVLLSAATAGVTCAIANARIQKYYNLDAYEFESGLRLWGYLWAYLRQRKLPKEEQETFPDCVPQMIAAFKRFAVTGILALVLWFVNAMSCALYGVLSAAQG